jgi:hypothetical protein
MIPIHEISRFDRSFAKTQKIAEDAFKVELNSPENLVNFKKHIEEQFKKWNWTKFDAPVFACIAPSMMGKSRMLSEVHRVGIFNFLVCFRPPNLVGVPVRTPGMANLLEGAGVIYDEYKSQLLMFRFIVKCAKRLQEWLKGYKVPVDVAKLDKGKKRARIASDWFEFQNGNTPAGAKFWTTLADELNKEVAAFKIPYKTAGPSADDWAKITDSNKVDLLNILTEIRTILKERGIDEKVSLSGILFTFDEATSLSNAELKGNAVLNMSHLLQRAFVLVPDYNEKNQTWMPVMAVFADTKSSVRNSVSAAKPWGNTARALTRGRDLMSPYYTIESMDGFAEDLNSTESSGNLLSLETEYTKYGRPAYRAMTIGDDSAAKTKYLIDVVVAKISGNSRDISAVQALSVLGVLVPLNVNPSNLLASELVGSRMRYCCGINTDRKMVFTMQLPEPVMAIAALKLAGILGWSELLFQLGSLLGNAVLDIGYKGELGMQLACLIATTKCHPNIGETEKVPSTELSAYLNALVGDDLFKLTFGNAADTKKRSKSAAAKMQAMQAEKKSKLGGLFVRVHQFVRFNGNIDSNVLLEYFKRGTGIVCEPNHTDCDLVIPVFYAENGPGTPLLQRYMTHFAIQVTLRAKKEGKAAYKTNSTEHLTREYCDILDVTQNLPYFTLYADLGPHSTHIESFDTEDKNQIAMAVVGFKVNDSNESDIDAALEGLLETGSLAHVNEFITEEAKEIIAQETQLTYNWNQGAEDKEGEKGVKEATKTAGQLFRPDLASPSSKRLRN